MPRTSTLKSRFRSVGLACALVAGFSTFSRSQDGKECDTPLTPKESLASLKTPEDLAVDLVLAEPTIAQPLFIDFDERGRLWVMEYRQYPSPAGLKMLSHDSVWRSVYDKVPAPPPHHFKGNDRISIHEDIDGDGVFDSHKIFVDGLNIATSFARTRRRLGFESTLSLVLRRQKQRRYPRRRSRSPSRRVRHRGHAFRRQQSSIRPRRSSLRRARQHRLRPCASVWDEDAPIHSLGQLIWRYDPKTKKYEIFAEGGGNAFGVELDAKGRVYSGHNGGNTRGFHYIQGGYYQKGFGKHGPLSNPFAFGYFPAMKHHDSPRFSHTFVFDESLGLPDRYRGKLFGVEPLLAHVVFSDVFAEGSTFRTRDLGFAITSNDPWFRPVDIKLGPDGNLYVADWYDRQINHWKNYQGQIDRSNGRVYRLRSKGGKPIAPVDLSKKSTHELIELLASDNRSIRQTCIRLLGDRADRSAIGELKDRLKKAHGQAALETLWALNLCGGLDEETAEGCLDHAEPFVRLWTVRLVCDDHVITDSLARHIAELATTETNIEARVQIACSARRLPAAQALPILKNLLAHDEDVHDPFLPLSIWWGIEANVERDVEQVLALFHDRTIWKRAIVRQVIVERLMRRFAGDLKQSDLALCSRLLARSRNRRCQATNPWF